MTLQQRAIRGFGWMLSGTAGQALLRILVLLVLARLLTPEDFGVVGAALVVVHTAIIFSNLGIPAALAQRLELEQRHIVAAFWLALVLGGLISVCVFLAAPLIERFFAFPDVADITRALAVVPLVAALGIVPDGLLRRTLRFRELAVTTVIGYAAGGAVAIGLAVAGAGVWALVGAFIGEHTTRTLLLLLMCPQAVRGHPERSTLRDILIFSGGITLRRLGDNIAQTADNIVVGRMLGAEALGLYGRAYQLGSAAPATIGRAMGHVAMPVMAKVQAEPERLRRAYLRATGALALVGLPLSAFVAILAPQVVEVALGRAWMGAVAPLQILACGIFLRLQLQLAEALGTAAGSVYAVAWRQGGYAGLVVVGALVGARWGLPGVACGVLAAQAAAYLLTAQLCLRITGPGWRQWLAAQYAGLMLGVVTALACTVVRLAIPDMPVLVILASVLLSGAACLLTLVMIGQTPEARRFKAHLMGTI